MMGLPDGWVTAPDIGLSWNEQVKALGNGVVPQQAQLALSIMWPRVVESLGIEAAA
jgi:DNA (cytosine-5)-methyltransferase 1